MGTHLFWPVLVHNAQLEAELAEDIHPLGDGLVSGGELDAADGGDHVGIPASGQTIGSQLHILWFAMP
jgi:hypothetical protein